MSRARLQEFEGRHDVSGEIFERRLVPVVRRAADASLVEPQNSHPRRRRKRANGSRYSRSSAPDA